MKNKKISIEKNSVQETLIIPLYGRKLCSEKFPKLYSDDLSSDICSNIDYDFSKLEKRKNSLLYQFGALEAAMRQLDIIWEIKSYLNKYPKATIVNLGCGLDQTGRICDNGLCSIVNIDFPDIIKIRESLIPIIDREKNIACDLRDLSWVDKLDSSEGIILFAAGVFHYLKKQEVKNIVVYILEKHSKAEIVFDTVGKIGLKFMMSKILRNMDIEEVNGYFSVENPKVELNWRNDIKISYRDYMLGYYDMKSPGINLFHRILAKLSDKFMKMKIIKMSL